MKRCTVQHEQLFIFKTRIIYNKAISYLSFVLFWRQRLQHHFARTKMRKFQSFTSSSGQQRRYRVVMSTLCHEMTNYWHCDRLKLPSNFKDGRPRQFKFNDSRKSVSNLMHKDVDY